MTKDIHVSQKTENPEGPHTAHAEETLLSLYTSWVEIMKLEYNILDFLIIIFLA